MRICGIKLTHDGAIALVEEQPACFLRRAGEAEQ